MTSDDPWNCPAGQFKVVAQDGSTEIVDNDLVIAEDSCENNNFDLTGCDVIYFQAENSECNGVGFPNYNQIEKKN